MSEQFGNVVMECLSRNTRIPVVVAGGVIHNRKEIERSLDDAYVRAGMVLLKEKHFPLLK